MDFSLSTEQKLLIDTVRRFIAEELQPLEDSVEASGELDAVVQMVAATTFPTPPRYPHGP